MCSNGKFIDRNPGGRPAGVPSDCGLKVSDIMKDYPRAELAEVWYRSTCPKRPSCPFFPTPLILPNHKLQDILAPESQKSHFAKFKEKFFEDLYLRKAELGKAKPAHSIPDDVTNENRSFGIKSGEKEDVYGLILPRKSADEVNRDYINWHDKYLISHQHYLPGERIHRNYNEKFKPNSCFGITLRPDLTGGQTKKCLTDRDRIYAVKELQKYYLERTFGDVGKKISKFKDSHLEDPNRVFGRPTTSKCALRDIVHNIDPCEEDQEVLGAIAYLHRQRARLNKDANFDVYELEKQLNEADPRRTGYIGLQKAFDDARQLHVFLNEKKTREAFIFYRLVEDVGLRTERIRIEDFSKSLQYRYLLPEIAVKRSIAAYPLDTAYRELCRDRNKPMPVTIPHFKKPEKVVEDSSSPEAFAKPRDKDQMKRIFATIVCEDSFERIWDYAYAKYKPEDGQLSVDQFRAEMKELRALAEGHPKAE